MTAFASPPDPLLQQAAQFERQGRRGEALQALRSAGLRTGSDPQPHLAIAQAAMRLGEPGLALEQMQRALALAAEDPDIHFQYACLLAHQGMNAQALPHFQWVAQARPDDPGVQHLLGLAMQRLGRNGEALVPLRRAFALAPANPRVLQALAESEFHAGHPDDAWPLWETLLRLHPDDHEVLQRGAETLNRLGRSDQALELLRQATGRQPQARELWMVMGQTAEDLGDRDVARQAYTAALALAPDWAFPISGLLALDRGKASDALLEQASDLLARPELDDRDRALLGYELGKALDGRQRYPEAMARWHDANAARRRMTGAPDLAEHDRQADRLIAATTPARLPAPGRWPGNQDPRPVWVVGMPRSGTTLTEQLLAAHPGVHGCGELPDLFLIGNRFARPGSRTTWPEVDTAALGDAELEDAAWRYLRAASRDAPADAIGLVDKAPLNFFLLDLAARLFPRSRVVWCRRDPRDIAVSVYGENFALQERLSTDLADIGRYINLQTRLMRHWQAQSPLPVFELCYEELAVDPEPVARRLLDFLGLDWTGSVLEFHRSERGVQTPSRWQVKQPIHTRSIGRWRHYQDQLAPLLARLDPDAYPRPAAAAVASKDQASTPCA